MIKMKYNKENNHLYKSYDLNFIFQNLNKLINRNLKIKQINKININ